MKKLFIEVVKNIRKVVISLFEEVKLWIQL